MVVQGHLGESNIVYLRVDEGPDVGFDGMPVSDRTGETRPYNTVGGYFKDIAGLRPVFNRGPEAWGISVPLLLYRS
jgi:hypothetical protein